MPKEIRYENTSRFALIGMTLFIIPVFIALIWFLWPGKYEEAFPPMWHFWGASVASLPLTLWAFYSLLPGHPVLATSPKGIVLGLWVRRGVPWRNVKDIRLSEIRMGGGLKKRWSAGRPYNQSIIVELKNPGDLYFEDWLHGFAHWLCFSRNQIRLPLKLVLIRNNDQLCAELRERWILTQKHNSR